MKGSRQEVRGLPSEPPERRKPPSAVRRRQRRRARAAAFVDATRLDWLDGLDDALIDGGTGRLEIVRERMLRTGESTRQAIDWFRQQEHDRMLQRESHATQ